MTEQGGAPQHVGAAIRAEADLCLQQGDVEKGWTLYQQLHNADPNNPDLLHRMSLLCVQRGDFSQALELVNQALVHLPGHPVLLSNLEVIRVKLGRMLIDQKEWLGAALQLGELVRSKPDQVQIHALLVQLWTHMQEPALFRYYKTLEMWYTSQRGFDFVTSPFITLFLDQEQAVCAANRQDRLGFPRGSDFQNITRLRVCYYVGEPILDAPEHLVCVPSVRDACIAFFVSSRLPCPEVVGFDPRLEHERHMAYEMADNLRLVRKAKEREKHRLVERSRQIGPEFISGQPLRVFFAVSRTGAAGVAARDLADAMREAGCEVFVSMESNDMESLEPFRNLTSHLRLQERIHFNPHIVVTLNGLAEGLHPDVFNVYWVLDPTPELLAGKPLPWRERDLVYACSHEINFILHRSGAAVVKRQWHTYDPYVFRDFGKQRKRKAVFVGVARSKNLNVDMRIGDAEKLIPYMAEMFESGEPMTELRLQELVKRSGCTREQLNWGLWRSVVRDHSVRWLCELSREMAFDVDIYGRFWEQYDWAQPFFRGELDHGPMLASVYNEATYALVAQPTALQSQRLLEIAACGTTPVVYDMRYWVEEPHWDEHCLWYRTKKDLAACLTGRAPMPPHCICSGSTHVDFAGRILADVAACLSKHGAASATSPSL